MINQAGLWRLNFRIQGIIKAEKTERHKELGKRNKHVPFPVKAKKRSSKKPQLFYVGFTFALDNSKCSQSFSF